MKQIFFIMAVVFSLEVNAQITKVSLQASGLTCSMCSNAINKALKTVDFVSDVDANIKTSTFEITFKPGSKVDFDKLKRKVEDAGFFVAGFYATYHFNGVQIKNEEHVNIDGKTFMFLNVKDQSLTGDRKVKIIDKGFVSSKEYKKNSALTQMGCYKTGKAEPCCDKDGLVRGTRIYHVTI